MITIETNSCFVFLFQDSIDVTGIQGIRIEKIPESRIQFSPPHSRLIIRKGYGIIFLLFTIKILILHGVRIIIFFNIINIYFECEIIYNYSF